MHERGGYFTSSLSRLILFFGLTPPRGVLLHGYPGTGKTLVVRALIGACSRGDKKIAYFARKGADCLGKYVGDAERQLRLLFQVAERSQPSIIFFDEIDGLAPCRSRQQDQTHNSVVSTLLSLLDGLKSRGSVIVIGATNRPDAVDPALRRPGRFDREIYFPLPALNDRSAILSLHTKSWPNPLSGSLLSFIANQTAGYAGADLQAICTQAAMNALKRNCALQELLSSAEKGSGEKGTLPSLPSFAVEERDWLAALMAAPPPCSRREAGMAASDVVSWPLGSHLLPCLLEPLVYLVLSINMDERIWLPSSLLKASTSVKGVIFSALVQRSVPVALWYSHLHSLIQQSDVANEIERILSLYGLVTSQSGPDCTYLQNEDDDGNQENLIPSDRNLLVLVEIQKVNLATMSQEGNGDIIRGLTQILLKCLTVGRCIIYMPRIDLWAIDEIHEMEAKHTEIHPETGKSSSVSGDNDRRKYSSEAWNSFVEQIDSSCASESIIVLATCELQFHDLPIGIRQFFSTNVLNRSNSRPPEHTIPRFSVVIDGNFNHEQVIGSCALKLAKDLVQHYVHLVHRITHESTYDKQKAVSHNMEITVNEKENMENRQSTPAIDTPVNIEHGHKESVPGNLHNKVMKGNLTLAIATFGYQILRYPHFSELCWVTSKLKEGPFTDINGPWKGWPFNSCIIHTSNSPEKVLTEVNDNLKCKEKSGTVRGLVAVGLLAYRGVYTSVAEVSFEVRKVLELLVGQIRAKILDKKDIYRYFHILSQVAYLEDIVNNWAYAFRSFQADNQTTASNAKQEVSDQWGSHITDKIPSMHDTPNVIPSEVQEVSNQQSPHKFTTTNGSYPSSDHALPTIDASAVQFEEPFQQVTCNLLPNSVSSPATMSNGDNSPRTKRRTEITENSNCLQTVETHLLHTDEVGNLGNAAIQANSCSTEACDQCNGLDNDLSPKNVEFGPDELGNVADQSHGNRENVVVFSRESCLYNCCCECLHGLYMLVRDILSNSLRTNGQYSTIDDVHGILMSCSLNLLTAIRKCYASQGSFDYQESFERKRKHQISECCSCHKISDRQPEKVTSQTRTSNIMKVLPRECTCHHKTNLGTGTIIKEKNPLVEPVLSFHFRDGVLVPSNLHKDDEVHCRFERLCVCSILEMIFMVTRPLS
uniref:AAA+ ATPase domain-containing protein n=1 Tax=Ananas comosus var. bracteatus TaxID=296719 RepID=A0A6V7NZ07_ANACO|nr:unnamed protein product [Ananas comosus var. bracteatus]